MTRSGLCAAVVFFGCATTPAPKLSLEAAQLEGASTPEPGHPALEAFLTASRAARLEHPVGAPLPAAYAQAWLALLDEADAFTAQPPREGWAAEAMRLRLRLETEYQTDAQHFGDVPVALAERMPRTLHALSVRLARQPRPARRVDPAHFRWPVDPVVVSSPYGERMHPIAAEPRFHAGVDLEVPLATPVRAAEAGTVVFSAWNGAHGRQVELQHDAHWTTRYSHLQALLVPVGAVVKQGQVVGLSGQSGLATGPHLHFELRQDGDALDPELFLRAPPLLSSHP